MNIKIITLVIILTLLAFLVGFYFGQIKARENYKIANQGKTESIRQQYLAELSKQEPQRQEFYAQLAKEKAEQEALLAKIEAEEKSKTLEKLSLKKFNSPFLWVENLDKAQLWYKKLTQIEPIFSENGYFYIEANHTKLKLKEKPLKGEFKESNLSFWYVGNLSLAVKEIQKLNIDIKYGKLSTKEDTHTATFRDPWNNMIILLEKK